MSLGKAWLSNTLKERAVLQMYLESNGVQHHEHVCALAKLVTVCVCMILKVQELAAGAMSWCASAGGQAKKGDLVSKLSKLGARGRHQQNAERDLQRMVSSFGYALDAKIETVSIHLWDPKDSCIYEADLPASRWQCFSIYTCICTYRMKRNLMVRHCPQNQGYLS